MVSNQTATRLTSTRPSSRRALTAALELAQEAVRLDSTNDDPIGAIRAYSRSVALLNEVMERVMHEEDDSGRGRHLGRPRSMAAREEEVRRLKSIHDTYADRMIILSDIYNIDPYNLPTVDPPAPTSGFSPTEFYSSGLPYNNYDTGSGIAEPTGDTTSIPSTPDSATAETSLINSSLPGSEIDHPPSTLNDRYNSISLSTASKISSRTSVLPPLLPPPSGPLPGRPRNGSLVAPPSSQLPLPKTTPSSVLIPRPSSINSCIEVDVRSSLIVSSSTKPKGNPSAHQRVNSDNKLEALHEEEFDNGSTGNDSPNSLPPHDSISQQAAGGGETPISTPSKNIGSSPPLPAKDIHVLPSLSNSLTTYISSPPLSPATPRGGPTAQTPQTAHVSQSSSITLSRSRGVSAPTPWSTDQHPAPIINTTTLAGTISQRRTKTSTGTISSQSSSRSSTPATQSSPTNLSPSNQTTPVVRLPGSPLPPLPSEIPAGRHRSSSQPPRPGTTLVNISISDMTVRPSIPQSLSVNTQLPRKPSFPSRLSSVQASASITPTPLPPQTCSHSSHVPSSPLPLPPPMDAILKPYHLMALLWTTMTSKSGGYITRRLHVPNEVWSQGGVKLSNLPEKVKVVEVLSSALEEIQIASLNFASNSNILLASNCTPDDAERWLNKLDDWNAVCDSIVTTFGRKLGINEGFVVKKSGGVPFWKVVRSMTNGKSLDSPAAYVTGLAKLFHLAQILGEHTKALLLTQMPPLYTSVPTELCRALELRLRRSSEFLASVVLTFVVKDLSLLLDKYVKKGEKWLAE